MTAKNWPDKKYNDDIGAIPVKVSVKILANVTAGLAKDVDEVNQYPAVINNATPIATDSLSFLLSNKIVSNNPEVAITSLIINGHSPRTLLEIWNIWISKI